MDRRALDVLGCPECFLPLNPVSSPGGTIENGILRCRGGHEYRVSGGVPMLVQEQDRLRLAAFAESYSRAWAKDGWGSDDPEYAAKLPYRDISRRRVTEWKVKAASMDALLAFLAPSEWPRVIDLGCGMGWLSHYLAARGYETYAMDAVLDGRLGLGAATGYVRMGPPFERVWGDMNRLPFLASSVDAIVCNASIHYVADLVRTLSEIARVLRSDGLVAILNSPIHEQPASAVRAQSEFREHLSNLGANVEVASTYHHLVRSELEGALRAQLGLVGEIPLDPGRRFRWIRRLKGFALGMELASFPIITARKSPRRTHS
jgi:SAM-dependent methyltransferase